MKNNWLKDVHNAETNEPEETNAIASILWELKVLTQHYHPGVRVLTGQCEREKEAEAMDELEGYLVFTYTGLFETERRRKSGGGCGRSGGGGRSNVPLTFEGVEGGLLVKGNVFDGVFGFGNSGNNSSSVGVSIGDDGNVSVVTEEK